MSDFVHVRRIQTFCVTDWLLSRSLIVYRLLFVSRWTVGWFTGVLEFNRLPMLSRDVTSKYAWRKLFTLPGVSSGDLKEPWVELYCSISLWLFELRYGVHVFTSSCSIPLHVCMYACTTHSLTMSPISWTTIKIDFRAPLSCVHLDMYILCLLL